MICNIFNQLDQLINKCIYVYVEGQYSSKYFNFHHIAVENLKYSTWIIFDNIFKAFRHVCHFGD